jgi:hypothetical protein
MKFYLFIVLLCYSLYSHSQDYSKNQLTLISPNRDTLWILNNETGKLIASSWESPLEKSKANKPVILMVNSLPYIKNNKLYGYIEDNK